MARLRLTPQNREFFRLYTQASANTVGIARLLVDLMERFPEDGNELIKTVARTTKGAIRKKRAAAR